MGLESVLTGLNVPLFSIKSESPTPTYFLSGEIAKRNFSPTQSGFIICGSSVYDEPKLNSAGVCFGWKLNKKIERENVKADAI